MFVLPWYLHLSLDLGMASLIACLFCFAGPQGAHRRGCRRHQKWQHCICMQGTAAEVAIMTQELSRLADDMLPKGETAGDDSGELGSLSQRLKASWDNKVGSVTMFEGTTPWHRCTLWAHLPCMSSKPCPLCPEDKREP